MKSPEISGNFKVVVSRPGKVMGIVLVLLIAEILTRNCSLRVLSFWGEKINNNNNNVKVLYCDWESHEKFISPEGLKPLLLFMKGIQMIIYSFMSFQTWMKFFHKKDTRKKCIQYWKRIFLQGSVLNWDDLKHFFFTFLTILKCDFWMGEIL